VRALQFVVALMLGVASTTAAQLAAPAPPSQRLLVLPFSAATADSAASIALADAVRDRVTALAKNKVLVVPKAKLCEALKASGFPCDGLLDDQQAKQLARFLQVHAYMMGTYAKKGTTPEADVHVIDIASSGMSGAFHVADANPGTTAALAEMIAQKTAAIVRISEPIRNCRDERGQQRFVKARSEANKALAQDSNSTGAWLCIATIFEAQRAPIDSVIKASQNALRGDSCNATAWENIARGYQQKGDTAKMVDSFISQLCAEPRNVGKYLGIAQLLRQQKNFDKAIEVLDRGLAIMPAEAQFLDLKLTICNETSNYKCASAIFVEKAKHDSTLAADSNFLKPAMGAAQQANDTSGLLFITAAAVRHFPTNVSFQKARAGAFEMSGNADSALAIYKKVLAADPRDVSTSLQIAKIMIDRSVFDTAGAKLIPRTDTAGARRFREPFVAKVDSARPYLRPGLNSTDSTQRLAASVITLTGGSKLAQAQAYDGAYPWLDTLLQVVAPKNAADTLGPRQQVRINGSFWYGLSSVLTLNPLYQKMTKAPKATRCDLAREVFGRLTRTRAALTLGRRVHPPTADQMLGFVAQYEKAKPQVQSAFKCSPAIS
jgi:tetratricopeptide (TPR) repeat protein